jgi:adenine-specific DNA-methyltransferase
LKHPAMMPKWLARDLILSWSNEGDTVLDPFAGSFTTCIEAEKIGRKAIGIEINPEYIKLL